MKITVSENNTNAGMPVAVCGYVKCDIYVLHLKWHISFNLHIKTFCSIIYYVFSYRAVLPSFYFNKLYYTAIRSDFRVKRIREQ